jgi:hypothetical protein
MRWRCVCWPVCGGPATGLNWRGRRAAGARGKFPGRFQVSSRPSLLFMPYPEARQKGATRRSPVACIRPAYSPCNTTYAEIENEEADLFPANLRRRPSVLSVGTFNPIGCSCQLYDSQRYIIPTTLSVFFWL